jgi:hypothetical protein
MMPRLRSSLRKSSRTAYKDGRPHTRSVRSQHYGHCVIISESLLLDCNARCEEKFSALQNISHRKEDDTMARLPAWLPLGERKFKVEINENVIC